MKEQLLLEGAVAGHMNHIYDNGEMTFGELKQLLQAAVDGKLRGTEKTDGQNVFLSFDVQTQKARAIRNKGHIKAGGLTVEQFDDFFSAHPNQALRYSFVEALQAYEDIIKELDKDTQLKIFGNKKDNIYFNTEVMNPGTPDAEEGDPRGAGTTNVIPYDKKTLLIHEVGHGMFDPKTALAYDDPDSKKRVAQCYSVLENALIGKSTEEPGIFSLETHPRRGLEKAGMKRASKVLPEALKAIDNVVSDFGLNDSNTIQDLVMVQIKPTIDSFGLTADRNKQLILRLMGLCKSKADPNKIIPCGSKDPRTGQALHHPRARMSDIADGLPDNLKTKIKDFDDNFKYQDYTAALSSSLYEFTNAILEGFESSFIADNKKAIKHLQDEIKASIKKIQNSANEAAKQDLEKQLTKLQDVKNVNTPSEGFVFDYNGTTYKFTGWFAPSNQILGTERYGRFGPIDPQESEESGLEASSTPLKIALFPGSFKPPHKGHVLAAQELAEDADVIYILVSAPQLSGRSLKSGGVITPNEAVQCWNAMIDKSPIKNKARVMIGPDGVASPMMTAINFIQHPADPNNIFAAPENSTVILGVGAKGSDADRYGEKILSKSKEKRPDLNIITKAVGPFVHKQSYLDLLDQHPSILQMLNKGKGRLAPNEITEEERLEGKIADKHLFHASDMRDFIDLAASDPIGIRFLQEFVPRPEDALAVLGILGINPADEGTSEEDQVQEPEVNPEEVDIIDLQEIINYEMNYLLEAFRFRVRQAPKAKKSSGKFQSNMKRRLSKAHATYLDMGRKDLTKHGGGFHKNRPKDISNAFLAEEDTPVEEITTVTNVGSPGFAVKTKRKRKMVKEQEKAERKLRLKIREGIKKFMSIKEEEHISTIFNTLQEHRLRLKLRDIILEQSAFLKLNLNNVISEVEDPTTDIHDNTGINTLKEMLKNTSVLSSLRGVYMGITTEQDQRKSFRAHIIQWVKDTLATVKLNDTESLDSQEGQADISEQVDDDFGIDIEGVNDSDRDKFIDAPDGSEKQNKKPKDGEDELAILSGEDTTGRNKAKRIYGNIEKSIVDYYAELDNPEDQEMFYDYLIANLKLYFDKWDGMMSTSVSEPSNDAYEQAKDIENPPGVSAG